MTSIGDCDLRRGWKWPRIGVTPATESDRRPRAFESGCQAWARSVRFTPCRVFPGYNRRSTESIVVANLSLEMSALRAHPS